MHLPRRSAAALTTTAVAASLAVGLTGPPAGAVNADHGNQVVSAMPKNGTPHVMNGAVMGITQIGSKIVVVGTFTKVSPSATFTNTADDLTRNRIFAFDANTGAIDPSFNPNLGGNAEAVDSDGTSVYVVGKFNSVGGNTAIKRFVKLNADGSVNTTFKSVPSAITKDVVVRGSKVYIGGAFKKLKSGAVTTQRGGLAAVDSTTGATLASLNLPFTGVYDPNRTSPGTTNVKRFDVNAAGTKLVAVGNFGQVAGQTRSQIAMIDLGANSASLSSWFTNRFDRAHNSCAGVFDTFTRDVDFSPNGSYFAVTTTGAFAGGANSGTMCDTTTRWETNSTGNDPTWVAYTGGDTSQGVAITDAAIYVGGHQRWQNNPFQGDQAGPGAVSREGIAALDPVNGLPLSWNPGRARGVGAQAVFANSQGVYVGSDTTLFAKQRRGRIAFLPLAGGSTIPNVQPASLPNTLFMAQSSGGLLRRSFDASGAPTGSNTTTSTSMNWSTVRGAFYLNGTIYYGLSSGGIFKRTFNPTTFALGSQQTVNLRNDPDNGQAIPWTGMNNMTGMFYDSETHRIYYTVDNTNRLYYRYFTPESEIVGAQEFTGNAGGVNLTSVAGMTLAGGRLLYGSDDGRLRSATFADGRITGGGGTVGSETTWNYRAMFVPN